MDMLLQSLRRHSAQGVTRDVGVIYAAPEPMAKELIRAGYASPIIEPPDWWFAPGRELRSTGLRRPVVACLNIWNDLPALKQTAESWLPHVDVVVVADGPYATTGCQGASTDGLGDWMASCPRPLSWVPIPGPCWSDQPTKRTALLQAAATLYPLAMLFVVDADEHVHNGIVLRQLPHCDVGWVQIQNPTIYRRRYSQPRIVAAHPSLAYEGRHHWLMRDGRLLATHQYGGPGWLHQAVPITITNRRGLGHTAERTAAKHRHRHLEAAFEGAQTTGAKASDHQSGARESLRILQLASYDAAGVASRLHTAINVTTPHAAVLGSDHKNNPFRYPVQFDLDRDHEILNAVWESCDILHLHLDYRPCARIGRSRDQWKPQTVIHHHGTMYRARPGPDYFNALDGGLAGLRLVSNLELLQYGENLHWLPNPTPVAEYRLLREQTRHPTDGVFRIAHSPSKRANKGTDVFLEAIEQVKAKGLSVAAVLIESQSHARSLQLKAECDAVFDSFWLGLQCSGLEGAAMGLPVIAGDADVADQFRDRFGMVPYTFAVQDVESLASIIERLVVDAAWRTAEADRVSRYVLEVHDEAAVALRYLDLLDDAFKWRTALRVGKRTMVRPPSEHPEPEKRATQEPEPATVHEPEPPLVRTA